MLEAYSTNLTVAGDTTVTFNSTQLQTGIVATLDTDNQTIDLNRAGIYRVDVNSDITLTTAGNAQLQLLANGNTVARAIATSTVGAGDTANLAFNTFVTVSPAPYGRIAKLQLQYTGGAGTIGVVDIMVSKVA